MLKSNPETGSIMIDADTQLTGIPPEAWKVRHPSYGGQVEFARQIRKIYGIKQAILL